VKISGFTDAELSAFRDYQRQSYAVLAGVAAGLQPGDTERDAARRMRKCFHEQGVHHYFHVPVALFGERTAYPGDFGPLEALSTNRRYEAGMPVVLDAAPIYAGYTVDTSHAAFAANAAQAALMPELARLRELILARVRERRLTFRAIAREVDEWIRARGLANCHRKHIAAVLGHRVTQVPDTWLHRRRIWGLGVPQAAYFLHRTIAAQRFGRPGSPNWNHTRASDHLPAPGLWAVEPHIARDGVGAKFEEILVITARDAYWLDDGESLPHHRYWRRHAAPRAH
jgi:Xaa-Pro aminopeptidase